MTVKEFINKLNVLYPASLSAEWDTDGLQVSPDPERELCRVLVALDAGQREISLAVEGGYDLLLTHHPLVFGRTGDIVPERLNGRHILSLVTGGVSAASFHTRLDAGVGGVNDCLCSALGITDPNTFGDSEMPTIGRIGNLDCPMSAADFAAFIKKQLNAPFVRVTGEGSISRVAVVGGAGKDLIIPALNMGADAIVTGEASYNSAIDAAEMGITVFEAGHYHTEFPMCERLSQLVREIAGAEAHIADFPDKSIII